MMRSLFHSLVASAAAFCMSAPLLAFTPDINDPVQVETFVDAAVEAQMLKGHSPSGVVAVMKDGKIIFNKGYGYQDVEKRIPVDPENTLFRPGSISKLFTWVSVMQQVEQGKLDLDADVNQYITQFQIEDTWPGQPVTLRHILTHTAGFEDGGFGYLIIDDPNRIVPLAESLATHIPERVNPPGDHTAYSNWATALAGLIVANVSGVEFNQYVQQNIFDVLGMNHASFVEPLPPQLDRYMAKAYGWKQGAYVEKNYEIISNFGPAGALAASAPAMAQFAKAILNGGALPEEEGGGRILQPETMAQTLTTLHRHDPRARGMAYGFLEYPYNGIDIIGHDGGTTVFISHFGLSQEHNLMVFSSFSGPGARDIGRGSLIKPFYDHFFPAKLEAIEPPSDFAERAAKYAGNYRPWRANFTKIEALFGAMGGVKVVPMADNTLLIGEDRYVEEEKNLFRHIYSDQRYAFQENENGEITGFIVDGTAVNQMFKVPAYGTLSFTLFFTVVSLIVFIAVLLRRAYQGDTYKALFTPEKTAFRASLAVAASNLLFVCLAVIAVITARDMMYETPWLLKFSLIFPIIALVAVLFHLYQSFLVWKGGYGTLFARARYSVVTLCGLIMLWIYNYWNLLGFNYFD